MRWGTAVTLAFAVALSSHAQQTFKVEFKLYRSSIPVEYPENDASSALGENKPIVGVIDGWAIEDDPRFNEVNGRLTYDLRNPRLKIEYEQVYSPDLAVVEDEEAAIQIQQEIPYGVATTNPNGTAQEETKFVNIGTTIRVQVSEATRYGVTLETNGEFVTLVGREGDGTPILDTVKWETTNPIPYGAWLFNRVAVQNGYEFMAFARISRVESGVTNKASAVPEYTVESKLVRVPAEQKDMLRKAFVYGDEATRSGDDARVFHVLAGENNETQDRLSFEAFVTQIMLANAEFVAAPRITVAYGPYYKIIGSVNQAAKDIPARPAGKQTGNGVTELLGETPAVANFLEVRQPYMGLMSSMAMYPNPTDGSVLGVDGQYVGVQIDPPANDNDNMLRFDLLFHQSFKSSGKVDELNRITEPYTFDNQTFRFPELAIREDGWFGVEFTSKQTGDLMYLLVQVKKTQDSHQVAANADDVESFAMAGASKEDSAYYVSGKLFQIPAEHAATVRKQFVYDEEHERTGDDARVFRVFEHAANQEDSTSLDLNRFVELHEQYGVDLVSGPRIRLQSVPQKRLVLQRNTADVSKMNNLSEIFTHFPIIAEYIEQLAPHRGVVADVRPFRDSDTGALIGFDGFYLGVQLYPDPSGDPIGLDALFHSQFNTGGREKTFFRKAIPYTFDSQTFRFPDLTLSDGGWIGIDFTSKKTGDLMLLFLEVDELQPGNVRFVPPRTDATAPPNARTELQNPYKISAKILRVPRERATSARASLLIADDMKMNGRSAMAFRNYTLAPREGSEATVTNNSFGEVGVPGPSGGPDFVAKPSMEEYSALLSAQYDAEILSSLEATVDYTYLIRMHTMMTPERAGGLFLQESKPHVYLSGGRILIDATTLNLDETRISDMSATPLREMLRSVPVFTEYIDYARRHGAKDGGGSAVLMDFDGRWADEETMSGFDGFVLGVRIDRREGVKQLQLSGDFHHQFPKPRAPESYDDTRFSFSDLWLHSGTWIGFADDDGRTGDTLTLLLSVEETIPQPLSGDADAVTNIDSFTGLSLSDDINAVLDIVPQIEGDQVRLRTNLVGRGEHAAVGWTNVIARDRELIVIGYDFDDAEHFSQLIGSGSVGVPPGPSDTQVTGETFHGIAVPKEIDFLVGITPQIEGSNIRLWITMTQSEDSSTQGAEQRVWTNVIVRNGDGLIFGCDLDGSSMLLDIRRAAPLRQ